MNTPTPEEAVDALYYRKLCPATGEFMTNIPIRTEILAAIRAAELRGRIAEAEACAEIAEYFCVGSDNDSIGKAYNKIREHIAALRKVIIYLTHRNNCPII